LSARRGVPPEGSPKMNRHSPQRSCSDKQHWLLMNRDSLIENQRVGTGKTQHVT
jgi:hypothetical protein